MAVPPRTTERAVKALGRGTIPVSADLTAAIESASMLVDAACVRDPKTGVVRTVRVYLDSELEIIERWLAWHFYLIDDPAFRESVIGRSQGEIESKVDLHLKVTRPGQQVMILDYLGGLADLNNQVDKVRVNVGVKWLGEKPGTSYDEIDRYPRMDED